MESKFENGILTVVLSEKIDSYTVGNIEKELFDLLNTTDAKSVILDCKKLEYIASAGL